MSSTLTAGALFLLLLWLTETTPWSRVRTLAMGAVVGFSIVWVPLLGYYAAHGAASAFLRNYFLVPRAIAMGFQNTWWNELPTNGSTNAYYFTPLVIVALGVLVLCDLRTLRLRRSLSPQQVDLLAFLCVFAACFLTALYRSDATHVQNTMIALPLVVVLAFRDLPTWSASTWVGRSLVRSGVVAAALWVYPLGPLLANTWDWILHPPVVRFDPPASGPQPLKVGRTPFLRVTAALSDEPDVVGSGGGPMRKFLEDADQLRDLIGDRATYVEGAFPYYTGLVYFVLDLKPAPFLFDNHTMIMNDQIFAEHLEYFRAHINEVECVVANALDRPEVEIFRKAHPDAVTLSRPFGATSVFVLMSGAR